MGMSITEEFSKVNDHTLLAEQTIGTGTASNNWDRRLSRLFNFKSGQVTTLFTEWLTYSSGPSNSSQMQVQNFSDIQSKDEIREMHAKLKELGGNPPDIEELLGGTNKTRLSAPGAG